MGKGIFSRLALASTACALLALEPRPAPAPAPDFARDIQPLLASSCYACHGARAQMGGLRLDSRQIALSTVIRPGDSAASPLYQRIAGLGGQARMPMGGKLRPEQIELVKRWIDQGAPWPEAMSVREAGLRESGIKRHWAFSPPLQAAPPAVRDVAWPRNHIDRFILARLEREGLAPSPEADRTTQLRRLSLDLIGLPPTPEEVDAFLADRSPDAWERQVERLLASPHYGERWGRIWLDAARYADSDGYEKDKQRQVWFYRDWVIGALNRNLPYNQFLIEQLAGDLLPNATQDQIVATGFLRNSMINEEGGIDPEEFRMEAMFDRMDAIGKSMLGVTIQCAQCHNHKFDPVSQEEYYRMFAILNDSHEASIAAYTPAEQMQRAGILRRTAEIEASLQHRNPDWASRMAAWERDATAGQPAWTVLHPEVDDISTGGQKYLRMEDGSFLAAGYAPTKHTVQLTVRVEATNITALRLELMNDANLPLGGPGRSPKGTCALTEFKVEAAPAAEPARREPVKIAHATADVNPPERELDPVFDDRSGKRRVTGPVGYAIDGDELTAWGIDTGPGQRNQPRKAVFTFDKPVANPGGSLLTIYLSQLHGGWNSDDFQSHNLGRFRLSYTTVPGAQADPVPDGVRRLLSIPRERRSLLQQQAIFGYWRTAVPEWQQANQEIATLWKQHPEGASQLVLARREKPRETHLLLRGDFLKPQQAVSPGVPAFLNPLPASPTPPDRLAFARWMVAPNAPTTARSFVNRVWQAYFGTGIVASTENLGTQCDPPSHPELLDWLAAEFMQRGWDIKRLHRLVVTSATYRQSSRATPALLDKDPYNRLLARGPRYRVDAELVRDIALSASGLLSPGIGGPSVYAPAPGFLFVPPASYGPKIWKEETGPARYRRALYTFRYRSVPYPALQVFDAPNGDTSCVRRARSNTPLQALTTLNEPIFLESARALAWRTLERGGTARRDRLTYAFRRCLSRAPTPEEQAALLKFLDRQSDRLREGWLSARAIGGLELNEAVNLPAGATPVELAAWTALSRVLLNLDETITKE